MFPEVSHVLIRDMPFSIEQYVHRIGRTGRKRRATASDAGDDVGKGVAITFFDYAVRWPAIWVTACTVTACVGCWPVQGAAAAAGWRAVHHPDVVPAVLPGGARHDRRRGQARPPQDRRAR